MKIRASKNGSMITFYKESTLESVLCDAASILVLIFLLGIDLLLSKLVGRSWVIDILTVFMFLIYMSKGMKDKEISIQEASEEINKLIDEMNNKEQIKKY